MKINWIKKLTSRKFWMAVASFVSMLIVAFGGSEEVAAQVTALIIAGATVVAYILGEGLADAAGVQAKAKPAYETPTATVEDADKIKIGFVAEDDRDTEE